MDMLISRLSREARERPDATAYIALAEAYLKAGEVQEALTILDILKRSRASLRRESEPT